MAKQKNKVTFDGEEIYDQSRRAESVLNHVLSGEESADDPESPNAEVPIDSELRARPIVSQVHTNRATSRVLFITSDVSFLTKGSAQQNEHIELASVFDEVHVLVLVNRNGKNTSIRCGDKTWVYSVHSPFWWRLPFLAKNIAHEMLVFNETFRPDIVVGKDPYEAGLSALFIAKEFARPVQIHISEDITAPAFFARNKWRYRVAKYVLKRVKSVRTKTDSIKELVEKKFKNVIDIALLPKFYNFSGYLKAKPSFNIHDTYKDFVFIMLTFAPLTADSHLHDTFTALHRTLKNPRMGWIIVGTGPAKKLFQDKVKLLEIERSVVFLNSVEDPISYMKTADVLIETSTTKESEDNVMCAAAAGLPILAVETELRNDLFKDGHSAFLCTPGDTICLTQKLTKFLNGGGFRKIFAQQGEQIIRNRLIEDPNSYYLAFRDSIEIVLEDTDIPVETKEPAADPKENTTPDDGLIYPKDENRMQAV